MDGESSIPQVSYPTTFKEKATNDAKNAKTGVKGALIISEANRLRDNLSTTP